MSGPIVRANTYRNVAGEIELIVTIDGAQVRGVLRDDDALRLARELARIAVPLPTVAEIRAEASVSDFAEGIVP